MLLSHTDAVGDPKYTHLTSIYIPHPPKDCSLRALKAQGATPVDIHNLWSIVYFEEWQTNCLTVFEHLLLYHSKHLVHELQI